MPIVSFAADAARARFYQQTRRRSRIQSRAVAISPRSEPVVKRWDSARGFGAAWRQKPLESLIKLTLPPIETS